MSARDRERENEIEAQENLAVLKKLRSSRKGQITKIEHDLGKYNTTPIANLKKLALEATLQTLENQHHFYSLVQDRILIVLQGQSAETTVYDEEESEGDEQLLHIQNLRQQLQDYVKAVDVMNKAKRIQLKLKMFVDSDSLADRDMEAKLQSMEGLMDEVLDAGTELPELTELTELIGHVHLSYRKFTKDVLRATPVEIADAGLTTHRSSDSHRPLYRLPKTDMPTYDGDPKAWRKFWERFTQRLSMYPDLPASEKIAQLEQAIKPLDGKALISAPKGTEEEYFECVKALQQRYDQPKKIYRTYVHETFEHSTPHTRRGLYALSTRLQDAMNGLTLYGGTDAGSVMVAAAEKGLNKKTMLEWSAHTAKEKLVPTMKVFREFLIMKAEELDEEDVFHKPPSAPSRPHNAVPPRTYNPGRKAPHPTVLYTRESSSGCKLCSDIYHVLFQCPDFKGLTVEQRQTTAQRLKVCTNCLGSDHQTRSCLSKRSCRTCGRKHHTLLHRRDHQPLAAQYQQPQAPYYPPQPVQQHSLRQAQHYQQQPPQQTGPTAQQPATLVSTTDPACNTTSTSTAMILGTCVTTIESQGRQHKARALLDNGSCLTFITTRMVNSLKMRKIVESTAVSGFQQTATPISKYKVEFSLRIPSGSVTVLIPIQAVVVDVITGDLPSSVLTIVRQSPFLSGLPLADPGFDKPGRIDLLLGVNVLPRVMLEGRTHSTDYSMSATRSVYGWVITGTCNSDNHVPRSHHCLKTQVDQQTQDVLINFWKVEDVSSSSASQTQDEVTALEHFKTTHTRQTDGRYVVKLPRKADVLDLGCSREQARRRYLQNEKSLTRKGTLPDFINAVLDYAERGHSERVPAADMLKPANETYYLPMHGVVKESSTTTKLRVVFDASARSSSGVSLNDQLLPGPNLYPHLTSIIISFRQHRIGMTGDISKMFREVGLHRAERDFHRYLVKGEDQSLQDWRMTRLTFGVTSSPFIATQVLHQVAADYSDEFPTAAAIIRSRFYVDDVLTGADTLEEAAHIRVELNQLLQKACMTLRKWRTNSTGLLESIPEELREKEVIQLISAPGECQKALGVHWDTERDTLHIATPDIVPLTGPTKRQIASNVAKTFDLLGWFAPSVVILKILLQSLWKLGMTWDEPVAEDLAAVWRNWQTELHYITEHPIPRFYYHPDKIKMQVQLHGFSDASNLAYGGVVYLRTLYQDTTVTVSLINAKTKVAPLSPVGTTPRLELCGAQVLSKLLITAMEALDIPLQDVFAWSDSTIVLCWLYMPPERLNTYVSNRVGDTVARIPAQHWRHVPTASNPADLASRGVSPKELVINDLWWQGPDWLLQSPEIWPSRTDWKKKNRDLPELRSVVMTVGPPEDTLIERFSSYSRLLRIVTWCMRFVFNLRQRVEERRLNSLLTPQELRRVELIFLRQSQSRSFLEEKNCLQNGRDIPRRSTLLQRRPFLDADGLLRVGGRLRRLELNDGQKHPVILHQKDHLTTLIARQVHNQNMHVGPTGLMGILSITYHILGAKQLVKDISKACITCQKSYARTTDQLMGQLPPCRATPAPPFTATGADFAGPFTLRKGHTRKPVLIKGYVCLFICLTTKSVHLELVMDLSTESFLAAFRRFVSRRGLPSTFITDNGTNFVGARRELEGMYKLLSTQAAQESVSQYLSNNQIVWSHSPARSPHFGGIWEAGVKQMKALLHKHLGTQRLTSEEFSTVIIEVEAILNSRPLTPLDSAPLDGSQVLTPGHFLVGRSLKALPTRPDVNSKITSLRRWNLCQRLTQDLWDRWSQDYLKQLQQFHHWKHPKRLVKVGDIVLLKDSELFNRSWPLARVEQVHPGADGLVRVVTLRTEKGSYKRAVTRLVPLLQEEESAASCPPEDVQV